MWGFLKSMYFSTMISVCYTMDWRKGWDSNPRYPCRHAGFQDRCLKPLGHPSVFGISIAYRGARSNAMRTWTQFGPNPLFRQEARRERRDSRCNRLVGLLRSLSLGVIPEHDGRVIANALGNGMNRNAG